ncbi:putative neprosin [Helianthus anomalus]
MRPIYHPNPVDDNKVPSMVNATADRHSSSSITQLWHSNGKCPKGTIPIRRTKKEDILRASSYAIASTNNGEFYGSKSALNLCNPQVQESNEFSLTQTWVVGGTYDTGLNPIEAGWQVSSNSFKLVKFSRASRREFSQYLFVSLQYRYSVY